MKILVIDDNVHISESLAVLLELSGYQAKSACDRKDALRLTAEFIPDLILMDMCMAVQGGELLPQIKAIDAEARVVVITGLSPWDREVLAVLPAVFDYISKPTDLEWLRTMLSRAMRDPGTTSVSPRLSQEYEASVELFYAVFMEWVRDSPEGERLVADVIPLLSVGLRSGKYAGWLSAVHDSFEKDERDAALTGGIRDWVSGCIFLHAFQENLDADADSLSEAAGAFTSALTGITRRGDPLLWASTQICRAFSMRKLWERDSGEDHLRSAIAAYRESLTVLDRDLLPALCGALDRALAGLTEAAHGA